MAGLTAFSKAAINTTKHNHYYKSCFWPTYKTKTNIASPFSSFFLYPPTTEGIIRLFSA